MQTLSIYIDVFFIAVMFAAALGFMSTWHTRIRTGEPAAMSETFVAALKNGVRLGAYVMMITLLIVTVGGIFYGIWAILRDLLS